MGRKNKHTKLSHAAHIKRHTEGTSNELSFSVLDAAKNAADAGEGLDSKAKVPRFGGIPLFTLPGKKKLHTTPQKEDALPLPSKGPVGMPAQLSSPIPVAPEAKTKKYEPPVDEIARRKMRRRVRNGLAIGVVAIALVALAATGVSFLYKEYTDHTERVTYLEAALSDLMKADEITVEMDSVITGEMSDEDAARVPAIEERLPDAAALLDSAEASVQAAESESNSSEEKEAIATARASIAARRDMISQGPILMDTAASAKEASDIVEVAWAEVIRADNLARDAAALIADTTMENVEASKAKSIEAKELFSDARVQFENAAQEYPSANLSAHIEYIEKRIAAMDYAIASDDAILVYDKDTAASQNDAYNQVDQEAAALAETLSDSPSDQVRSAYLRDIEEPGKLYSEARSVAATADAFIRDYLGSNGK